MYEKLEAQGGPGGDVWDDGVFNGVRKVYVGYDIHDCIGYIKFKYKNGSEIEKREYGVEREKSQKFAVDHPYEYIVLVEGTYGQNMAYGNRMITSLTFRTSEGRCSPIFGNPIGEKFVLEKKNGKLVGFHGRAGESLDAIGAYFKSTLIKSTIEGGHGGDAWDTGVFDRLTKVYVGEGNDPCIGYVKFEYERDGHIEAYASGMEVKPPQEFGLNDEHEYITSVEGTYDFIEAYRTPVITSIAFKTSKNRTSPRYGYTNGKPFVLEVAYKRYKLVGFHGRSGGALDAIGAYFAPVPQCQLFD